MAATALAAVIQDTYIQRIATCAVDNLLQALGKGGTSSDRLCRAIDGLWPRNGCRRAAQP